MKKIYLPAALTLLLAACADKPSNADVYEAIMIYQSSGEDCDGEYTVEDLDVKSVDSYNSQFEGWKVTYGFRATCKSTYTTTQNQMDKPVDVFVRKTENGYEAFLPGIFEKFQEEFEKEVNEQFRNIKFE